MTYHQMTELDNTMDDVLTISSKTTISPLIDAFYGLALGMKNAKAECENGQNAVMAECIRENINVASYTYESLRDQLPDSYKNISGRIDIMRVTTIGKLLSTDTEFAIYRGPKKVVTFSQFMILPWNVKAGCRSP